MTQVNHFCIPNYLLKLQDFMKNEIFNLFADVSYCCGYIYIQHLKAIQHFQDFLN